MTTELPARDAVVISTLLYRYTDGITIDLSFKGRHNIEALIVGIREVMQRDFKVGRDGLAAVGAQLSAGLDRIDAERQQHYEHDLAEVARAPMHEAAVVNGTHLVGAAGGPASATITYATVLHAVSGESVRLAICNVKVGEFGLRRAAPGELESQTFEDYLDAVRDQPMSAGGSRPCQRCMRYVDEATLETIEERAARAEAIIQQRIEERTAEVLARRDG